MDSAVVDIGASNVEELLDLMQKYQGSHEDFDAFVVPTVPTLKQQQDTIATLVELARLGVPRSRVRLVFNMVSSVRRCPGALRPGAGLPQSAAHRHRERGLLSGPQRGVRPHPGQQCRPRHPGPRRHRLQGLDRQGQRHRRKARAGPEAGHTAAGGWGVAAAGCLLCGARSGRERRQQRGAAGTADTSERPGHGPRRADGGGHRRSGARCWIGSRNWHPNWKRAAWSC